MNKQSDDAENDCICINIPEALYGRVEDYCKSTGIEPYEFIFDAISEKLFSIHRERRRKPRL